MPERLLPDPLDADFAFILCRAALPSTEVLSSQILLPAFLGFHGRVTSVSAAVFEGIKEENRTILERNNHGERRRVLIFNVQILQIHELFTPQITPAND